MKDFFNFKQFIFGVFISMILVTTVSAAILLQAEEVSYSNALSKDNVVNVKEALYELYKKSKTNCPEGYICKPGPKSFAEDSWKMIFDYINDPSAPYHVGDTKEIDMGTYGVHTIRIANKSTPDSCNNSQFSQTACGVVIEFADIITLHNYNPAGFYLGKDYDMGWAKGGWPASNIRIFVKNSIYNALPTELKDGILDTKVISGYCEEDTSNYTSTDKLYLLSPKEIYGDTYTTSWNGANDTTRQFDYYYENGVTATNYSLAIKNYNGEATYWWQRDAYTVDDVVIFITTKEGKFSHATPYQEIIGISPAFRIG